MSFTSTGHIFQFHCEHFFLKAICSGYVLHSEETFWKVSMALNLVAKYISFSSHVALVENTWLKLNI